MKQLLATFFLMMASIQMMSQDYYSDKRETWLKKAEDYKPQLSTIRVEPKTIVRPVSDSLAFQGLRMEIDGSIESLYKKSLKQQNGIILDFGRHLTGHFSFLLKSLVSVQDAALRLRFTFGEVPSDVVLPYEPFNGTLSRGWLQDIVVDVMPSDEQVTIPRRLACRYVKIELLGASQYYDFTFDKIYFTATTSAGQSQVKLLPTTPRVFQDINHIAEQTLSECMQTVYEDGPKRDQRLWMGDLYLEALANSVSFRNYSLTRRCLYLLAALSNPKNGLLYSNCFEKPQPHPQKTFFVDYALQYNLTLLDYLNDTGDQQTAEDLWPVAYRQVEALIEDCVRDGVYDINAKPLDTQMSIVFFDWNDALDKRSVIQMMMPYAIDQTYELACRLGHTQEVCHWPAISKRMKRMARQMQYRPSCTSEAWAVLAGIYTGQKAQQRMLQVLNSPEAVHPSTPYAWHFVIDALIRCGLKSEARKTMEEIWGSMTRLGADTFWEVYMPEDHFASPYKFAPLNSYCHAWSCTPVYFIQKYPEIFQR